MKKKIGLIVFVLICLVEILFSSNRDIRFRNISLEEGLSQSVVSCILQDSKGFMWFGTQDGLNKYDGYSFKVYRPDPENPKSISNNNIITLHEDHLGAIWIGTNGGGLNKFDRETEQFIHYQREPNDPTSLSSDFVRAVHEDRSHVLWIGTDDGLNRFHPETGTFTCYRSNADDPSSLSSSAVSVIYEDRSGVLWIGTADRGFNPFDPETETFTRHQVEPGNSQTANPADSLSSNSITDICEDHSGELWIGTTNGLNRYDRETARYTVYRFDPGNPYSLGSNNVSRIYEDHAGVLWICTTAGGINTFDRRTEGFVRYLPDPDNPTSLSSVTIASIFEDRSGILWFGTGDSGIDYFDREIKKFRSYRVDPDNPNSLSHDIVYSLFEDRFGVLWIATNGGGLNKYDRRNGQFTHFRANPGEPNGLSSDFLFSIYEDSTGVLWIGTNGAGLDKFDRETGTFKNYRAQPDDPYSLSSSIIRFICEDSRGILWIGTLGGGINTFDRETEQFHTFRNIPGDPTSLSDNQVRCIYEGRDGVLWIGTTNGGLNKLDRKTGQFTHYRRDLNEPHSLSSDFILCIYQDPSGHFWIGTYGGGLNKFDPRKGICTRHYRDKDGLPNDVVYGILPDEQGCLWFSTNKGLSKFDPRSETFKNYTYRDGLQSNEFNGGAFYKSKSGEMFFGGVNGFNAFYPHEVKDNENIPPIVITDFQIFNKPVAIGSDSPLKKHITETTEIKLPYRDNVFSFKFVALDYTIPEKNQYKYMMEGFDKEWIFSDAARRFASYTNLDPGEYTFQVKGSNNDGVWNEKGTSIKIIITPPFWQTGWFRVLAGLLAVGATIVFHKTMKRHIAQKARLLTELQTARAAQMSIMPQSDPQIEGFYISGVCVPAHEVGGDFFDYIWLNREKTKFGIAIGDVSGKAMQAAMTAVLSSGMLYSKVDCVTSVKEIMTELNRPLYSKTDKKMFTALCLASLDIRTKEFVFTNAGLSEPLLKSQNSTSYIESIGPRLPLGSFKDNTYQETKLQLKPFDVVVLVTDGIPEAQNRVGKFYGYDSLKNLVEKMDTTILTAAEIKETIISDVKRFSGDEPQHDDMTVVVIKYQGR
jgi:ligand-binding sensor domain-containing protein/serine phosphatase RsbU (regulator of sigma subunit)